MTQEEKELLLKDLCARLPYGFVVHRYSDNRDIVIESNGIDFFAHFLEYSEGEDFKPYLRPMSSMTNKEKRELQSFYPGCFGGQWLDIEKGTIDIFECSSTITLYLSDSERIVDWFNKNIFDYRGLIEKGLALEAPKGMYNN